MTAAPAPELDVARPATSAAAPVAFIPVSSTYRWLAASIVALGSASSILSATVPSVALPALQHVFSASLADVQWILSGYQLGLAAVIPASGYLSDRFGTKRVYVVTLVLFVLASLLCGLAWNVGSLIGFRLVQGIAGGMVMPVGMTMVMTMTPAQARGRMMGVLGVPMLLAPALGPAVGGWLLRVADWRWVFWMNVPAGILAVALGIYLLRSIAPGRAHTLDVVGLLLATPGVALVILGMTETSTYGWLSAQALLPLLTGALLVAAFLGWELRQAQPLLDLRVFTDPGFSAAMVVSVILAIALFGAVFLVPLYMQEVQGKDTLHAGLLIGAQGLGTAVMMPISGWLTDRYGARPVVLAGVAVMASATYLMSTLSPTTSDQTWVLLLTLRGLGMGSAMMPAISSAYARLHAAAIARATAVSNTMQRLAASFGIALMATLAESRITAHVHAVLPTGGGMVATADLSHLPAPLLAKLGAAITAGFSDTFILAASLALFGLPAALLLRRPQAACAEAGSDRLPALARGTAVVLTVAAGLGLALGLIVVFGLL